MRIYISGKMGLPFDDEIKDKFGATEKNLLDEMADYVVNPVSDEYRKERMSFIFAYVIFPQYLHDDIVERKAGKIFDITRLCGCDAIYMLKDWRDSPDARAEHAFAKAIGLKILYEEEDYVDMSVKDVVEGLIGSAEEKGARKVFMKLERVLKRDWDMILTVVRHKEKGAQHG
ncbi:MAG: DUF4406 domain-containing protein [Bacteroidaceae bacterium]|nr:DUF4406 domain-containing protein [Bacteroidaceae bacterium]